MLKNKIHIFLANYGSGKTEFSLNYALKLKESNKKVAVVDLDVVNLYFRSRDVKALINGEIVSYDACSSESEHEYNVKIFKFIGKGFVYSVDGVRQNFEEEWYFYKHI